MWVTTVALSCLLLPCILTEAQYYLRDQTLGCDGVIGSGRRVDRCGECGGNNSTCKVISGIYTKRSNLAAYEYITEIPRRARNINITEAKNTRNYLALRYASNSRSIINGNWSLDWAGTYRVAGTTVEYKKPRTGGAGEAIYIKGPLEEAVQLLLLVQTRNPGIYYKYTLPVESAAYNVPAFPRRVAAVSGRPYTSRRRELPLYLGDSLGYGSSSQQRFNYQWKVVGRTQCSRSCGEGYSEDRVVCILVSSQVTVTEKNCLTSTKPLLKRTACSTQACPPVWETDEWTTCSTTCGDGTQTRIVECKRRLSAKETVSVYAMNCDRSRKPSTVKMCRNEDCYTWSESEWSECSAKCGAGKRQKTVHCIDLKGRKVGGHKCVLDKPRHIEKCYSSCERSWFYSEWTNKCAVDDCREGNQTRRIYCPADGASHTAAPSLCGTEPQTTQTCDSRPECNSTSRWFTGEWSNCVGDCRGAYQNRPVVCMANEDNLLEVTREQECDSERRPHSKQKCRLSECDREASAWFVNDWSLCSVTCGSGYQRRKVKCLDKNQKHDTNCVELKKPQAVKSCTKPVCAHNKAYNEPDPNCRDQYGACQVVVQARLCKLSYYRQVCCRACSHARH